MSANGTLSAAVSMESLSSIEETLGHEDSHNELKPVLQEFRVIDGTELQDQSNLSEAKIDSLSVEVHEIRANIARMKQDSELDSKKHEHQ